MINWSVDEEKFKRRHPRQYRLWRLTQLINYGLDGEKLDREEVKKAWPEIKSRLDPEKQKVIEFYLWDKKWRKEPGLAFDRSNFWTWQWEKATSSKISI